MKSELEALVEKMIAGGILFEEALKEFEKHFILRVVTHHHHNLSKAADELGIHRNTLTKRLQEYEQGNTPPKGGNGKGRQHTQRRRTRVQSLSK
jgi:DNA-binding NtrC family response regulator